MRKALLTTLLFISPLGLAKPMHIIIDPGHGGPDRGATRKKVQESKIVLTVSHKVRQLLEADKRFQVSMTRKVDKKVDLRKRAEIANRLRGDLFVSIHANASLDQRANGAEFYLQNHLEPSEEMMFLAAREEEADSSAELKSQIQEFGDFGDRPTDVLTILDDLVRGHRIVQSDKLASSLFASWHNVGRRKKNAIRQAPFFLTSNVHMPSVLVELGYISHKNEVRKLISPQHQKKMALNIYKGIVHYHSEWSKNQ